MLRNSASGLEIGPPGGTLAELLPGKIRNRPPRLAFGRQEGRFRIFPGSSPAKILPGRPNYGPEALLHNIGYILLTRRHQVVIIA